ncbi:hypothetical protein AABB24_000546 [Solanum stoloniferum]
MYTLYVFIYITKVFFFLCKRSSLPLLIRSLCKLASCFLAMLVLALQSGDYQASNEGGSQSCLEFLMNYQVVPSSLALHLLFHSFCACSRWVLQIHRFFFHGAA